MQTFTLFLRRPLPLLFLLLLSSAAVWAQPNIGSLSPTNGDIGTTVTISGSGFTGVTGVRFGELAAKFTINSASQITATVPRVASTQRILITSSFIGPTGQNAYYRSASPFTVTRASSSLSYGLVASSFAGVNVGANAAPAVGDLDNDNLLDLLVGRADGTISRYEQTVANGPNFTSLGVLKDAANATISVGSQSTVAIVDINSDGRFCLFLGRGDGTISEYKQTALNAATFALVQDNLAGISTPANTAPCMTDLDGDGNLELLVGKGDGIISYYEQSGSPNGDGFYRIDTNFNSIRLPNNAAPFCTDLDGNGLLDLLMGRSDGTIYHFEQASVGTTFMMQQSSNFAGISAGTNAKPTVTDIDGDGLLDLLVGRGDGTIDRYEQGVGVPSISSFTPTSGPVGTTVTVTGTNLAGVTAATVNGTAGTITGTPTASGFTFTVGSGSSTGLIGATTPGGTASSTGSFTVTTGTNTAPTDISLSNASVAENQPVGTPVGTFSSTDAQGGNFTYTFAVGGADNGAFNLPGGTLTTNRSFDFEAKSSYSIKIRSTDAGGLFFEKTFTVTVGDVNETPTITSFTPTSGPVGTSGVVITGTNFSSAGAATVRFNGTTATATVDSDTQITATVPAGATTGNISVTNLDGTGASSANFTVSSPATVVSILRASANPSRNATVTYTVTFNRPVTGLTAANFTLVTTGGQSGASLSATPTENSTFTAYNVTVNTGPGDGTLLLRMSNSTGLAPTVSNLPFDGEVFTIDRTAPTVVVTSPASPSTGTAPIPFTITFSEGVSDPAAANIVLTNGTAGSLTGSGSTFSLTVTPTAPGAVTARVPANVTTDAAGNANTASNTLSVTYAPAPAVTSVAVPANGTYGVGQPLNFSVSFDQAVTVNTAGGTPTIALTVGAAARTASYVSGSGSTALVFRYTVVAGDLDANGVSLGSAIALNGGTIRSAGAANAALTLNSVGSTTGVLVDGVGPTATVSSTAGASGGSTPTAPIPFVVTFSENVTGFNVSDVTVTGGTATVSAVSGSVYNVSVTPTSPGSVVTVSVAANVATDGVGNGNAASNAYSLTYAPAPAIINLSPSSGPVGATVIITGSNFTGATAVRFNGLDASSYVVNSSTQITAVVAAGTTSGAATVVTPAGTSNGPIFSITSATTTTTLVSSVNPSTVGQSVTFTATVTNVNGSATPAGTVSFRDGGAVLGSGTLDGSGVATFNTSALTQGSHSIIAIYLGRTGFTSSTSATLTQVVNNAPTTTTLTSSLNPSTFGQSVTFTATVAVTAPGTGTPTGTVTFKDGSTTLGTGTLSGGAATFSISNLTQGSHSITAVYGGATSIAGSTSAVLTQVVDAPAVPAITTLAPSSGPVGTSVTISGSNLSGATSVSFAGAAQTTITGNTGTSLTVTVPAGAITGDATVTTPSGESNALTFTVTPPAPVVTSVAGPANGTYRTGQFLTFLVSFDQPVTVSTAGGTPVIILTVGSTPRGVTYFSGSGTSTLTFRYLVQAGDLDANGVTLGSSIAANNGTLRNATGTDAVLTLNNVAALTGVLVDGVAPTAVVSTTAASPSSSSVIPVTITFSEPVTGLTAANLVITNGTPGTLSGSGTTYTLNVTAGASGAVTVKVNASAAQDAAGNPNAVSNTLSVTYTPPPVSIASFTPTNGAAGTAVVITGSGFTGATAVTINNGAVASYTVDSNTQITATVAATNTTGLVRVTAPAGTGTSATNFVVGPAITGVTATGNGTFKAGQTLTFAVAFSQAVTVSTAGGTPTLALTVGSTVRSVPYASGNGSTTLQFRYVIVAGDLDMDGVTLSGTGIDLNGGTIRNSSAVDADLDFNNLPDTSGLLVDAVVPTVVISSSAGSSTPTSPIPVTLTFSEPVTGLAATDITVTNGTKDSLSGSGTTYTINVTPTAAGTVTVSLGANVAQDAATNGNVAAPQFSITYDPVPTITGFAPQTGTVGTNVTITGTNFIGTTAVAFNGLAAASFTVNSATSITAVVPVGVTTGRVTVTTLAGTATSPYNFTPIVPAVFSVAVPADGTYGVGQALDFSVLFDQVVSVGGAPRLTLTVGSTARNVPYVSGSGSRTLVFRYTVVAGDLDANGVVLGSAITLNGGTIRNAGNSNASLALRTIAPTTGVLVDGVVPTVALSSTASSPTSTSPIPVTITFSKPVTGLTLASLTMTNGSAGNLAGSGTTYTVDITPAAGGTVAVNLAAASAQDAAGNDNTAAPQFSITYAAPVVPTITSLSAGAELPGMPVTLTGTGFVSGSTVTFGGVVGTGVVVNSSTSLTVTVPAGAAVGSSAIVVTSNGMASASAPAFAVLAVYDGGLLDDCTAAVPPTASLNDGQWHYLLSAAGQVVLAYRHSGSDLGTLRVDVLRASPASPVRRDFRNRAYLDRNFHLVASNGPFTGLTTQVRFYGLTSELARLTAADPAATLATLKATQYSGPNEDCDLSNNNSTIGEARTLGLAASTPGNGVVWFVAQATVPDHFSEFYLTGSSTPLPVELSAFTAEARGSAVALAWATASEKNSARFEIERSPDGRTFERIAQVAAAGNSSRARNYELLDTSPPPHHSTLYYRLRQVDQDGTAAYSPVRAVALTQSLSHSVTLFPNPAHGGAATLTGAVPGTAITVLDALGRVVTQATAAADGTARLSLPAGLATGVYVVRGGSQAIRLVIE